VILVDTNAWVTHVRSADLRLVRLLYENRVVTSEVVLGELLLGAGLPPALVRNLELLPQIPSPGATETREYVERHLRIFRVSGVGWADAQIIASSAKAGALIYSSDRAVRSVWRRLGFRLG
jgi:predicted nucleic acid-binding protein